MGLGPGAEGLTCSGRFPSPSSTGRDRVLRQELIDARSAQPEALGQLFPSLGDSLPAMGLGPDMELLSACSPRPTSPPVEAHGLPLAEHAEREGLAARQPFTIRFSAIPSPLRPGAAVVIDRLYFVRYS